MQTGMEITVTVGQHGMFVLTLEEALPLWIDIGQQLGLPTTVRQRTELPQEWMTRDMYNEYFTVSDGAWVVSHLWNMLAQPKSGCFNPNHGLSRRLVLEHATAYFSHRPKGVGDMTERLLQVFIERLVK